LAIGERNGQTIAGAEDDHAELSLVAAMLVMSGVGLVVGALAYFHV
jgi:hypothetical protein